MLRRINWAACLPAAAVVGALAVTAGVLGERARADGSLDAVQAVTTVTAGGVSFEYRDIVAWADETPALQTLTPEQCLMAASTVRTTGKTFREFISGQDRPMIAQFEAEQAAAEAWVSAGCPPDPVRGGFMGSNGSLQLKPYARQSFSGSADGQGGTYIVLEER